MPSPKKNPYTKGLTCAIKKNLKHSPFPTSLDPSSSDELPPSSSSSGGEKCPPFGLLMSRGLKKWGGGGGGPKECSKGCGPAMGGLDPTGGLNPPVFGSPDAPLKMSLIKNEDGAEEFGDGTPAPLRRVAPGMAPALFRCSSGSVSSALARRSGGMGFWGKSTVMARWP